MTEVTAAIIRNDNNQILICQRPVGKSCALLWEFPGGKQEPNESLEECIIRECKEELDIVIKANKIFAETTYDYPEKAVHMTFFESTIIKGSVLKKEHNDIRWVSAKELCQYDFCPADVEIVNNLSL